MKPRAILFVLFLTICSTACASTSSLTSTPENVEEVGIIEVPSPTTTPLPTFTPSPTATRQPTVTITPSPSPSPTLTFTPSPTHTPLPTQTPTFTPLPITPHTWEASPVLIQFNRRVCVDSCYGDTFSALPSLILYSDGLMINELYVNYEFRLQVKQMTRNEVCALLNTIDLFGFLDYDPTEYLQKNQEYPRLQSYNYIEVNAWQSNKLNAGGLTDYFVGGTLESEFELDSALSNTYQLLREYSQQNLDSYYVPERMIVLVQKINQEQVDTLFDKGVWPLEDISLEDLFNKGIPLPEGKNATRQIVEGSEALTLFDLFGRVSAPSLRIYSEEGQPYGISVRVLLPYESLLSIGSAYGGKDNIPGPDVTYETNEITCSPEDGVVESYYSILENEN